MGGTYLTFLGNCFFWGFGLAFYAGGKLGEGFRDSALHRIAETKLGGSCLCAFIIHLPDGGRDSEATTWPLTCSGSFNVAEWIDVPKPGFFHASRSLDICFLGTRHFLDRGSQVLLVLLFPRGGINTSGLDRGGLSFYNIHS